MEFDRERMERALSAPRFRLPDHIRTPAEICGFLDSLSLFRAIAESKDVFTAEAAYRDFGSIGKG